MTDAALTVEENGIKGSATCCLVVVDTLQGRLNSANIGDSGYVILGELPRLSAVALSWLPYGFITAHARIGICEAPKCALSKNKSLRIVCWSM